VANKERGAERSEPERSGDSRRQTGEHLPFNTEPFSIRPGAMSLQKETRVTGGREIVFPYVIDTRQRITDRIGKPEK
jgi:hypothetical protein